MVANSFHLEHLQDTKIKNKKINNFIIDNQRNTDKAVAQVVERG